jgi:quercetin dioxygenase-like cupin family protein
MNPLSQFKKILILPLLIALSFVVAAAPALATPPSPPGPPSAPPYLMTEFILSPLPGNKATFDEIDVFAKWDINPSPDITDFWKARIDTKGASDLYVVRNTFDSGATTGWHTHPGPSLITVTVGTITAYDGDDPTCTPHIYPQGSTFIDPGGGHVHLLRNESGSQAVTVAVQLVPDGFARRIDRPNPGNCPNIN